VETPGALRVRRGPVTWLLLALAGLLTAVPAVSAVLSVLTAAGLREARIDEDARRDYAAVGLLDEQGLRVMEGMAALVTVPVAIACLAVLLGLARWKPWAREGALGLFGLTSLLLLALSLSGLTQDPPGRHAGLGVLGSLVVLAVAVLTVSPPVRRDFERREVVRALRERQAAAAARRARTG
jgi:hypothetical protein